MTPTAAFVAIMGVCVILVAFAIQAGTPPKRKWYDEKLQATIYISRETGDIKNVSFYGEVDVKTEYWPPGPK